MILQNIKNQRDFYSNNLWKTNIVFFSGIKVLDLFGLQ